MLQTTQIINTTTTPTTNATTAPIRPTSVNTPITKAITIGSRLYQFRVAFSCNLRFMFVLVALHYINVFNFMCTLYSILSSDLPDDGGPLPYRSTYGYSVLQVDGGFDYCHEETIHYLLTATLQAELSQQHLLV